MTPPCRLERTVRWWSACCWLSLIVFLLCAESLQRFCSEFLRLSSKL